VIVVDSGVLVAAFGPWHEAHPMARDAVRDRPAVVAHSLAETYSVLTRLPAPFRASADVAGEFLLLLPVSAVLDLEPDQVRTLLGDTFPRQRILGGATYDALVGATAVAHDATLLTLDRRARVSYDRVGCRSELLVS